MWACMLTVWSIVLIWYCSSSGLIVIIIPLSFTSQLCNPISTVCCVMFDLSSSQLKPCPLCLYVPCKLAILLLYSFHSTLQPVCCTVYNWSYIAGCGVVLFFMVDDATAVVSFWNDGNVDYFTPQGGGPFFFIVVYKIFLHGNISFYLLCYNLFLPLLIDFRYCCCWPVFQLLIIYMRSYIAGWRMD